MPTIACSREFTLTVNQGAPPTDAWWTFQEVQPTNYLDSVAGYETDPYTQGGCVITTAGIRNNCVGFCSLATGQLLTPITGPAFVNANATGMSFCFWGWFDTGWLGDIEIAFTQDHFTPTFYLNMGTNRPSFVFDPSGTTTDLGFTGWPIAQWFFAALVWDKAANSVKVYLNGVQLGSTITVAATPPSNQPMGLLLYRGHNNNLDAGHFFMIDEAAVNVTKPFSSGDIGYLYNSGLGRTYPP